MAQIASFLFFTMSFCLLMIGPKENRFRNMHVVGLTFYYMLALRMEKAQGYKIWYYATA